MKETVKIILSVELIEVMDKIVELIGFRSRENLVEVAVRGFLDQYKVLLKSANQLSTAR